MIGVRSSLSVALSGGFYTLDGGGASSRLSICFK